MDGIADGGPNCSSALSVSPELIVSSPDDSGTIVDEGIAKHVAASSSVNQGEAYLNGLRNFLGQMHSGEMLRSEFARVEQSDDDVCSQDSDNDEGARRGRLEFVS